MVDTFSPTLEISPIQTRLKSLERDRPDLSSACAYYGEILPLLKEAQAGVALLTLDVGRAQQKLEQGKAVLQGECLPFSELTAQRLFRKICAAITAVSAAELQEVSMPHRAGISSGRQFVLVSLMEALLAGDPGPLAWAAGEFDLEPLLLRVFVQNCLKPFLYVWAGQLAARLDVSQWKRGRCPFCGSAPLFAELRGVERARFLRCGLCGAGWPFSRLQCPACETVDTRRLGLLQPEGRTERFSVQTCDACHMYIKMMITTEPLSADLLLVEDLSSINLDWIAVQSGFARPS